MNRVVLMIVSALFCGALFTSCDSNSKMKEDDVIALSDGHTLNLKDYQWLKKLIDLSKADETGHYIGCIWLENYKGHEIFVTNMMLGSGGIMYWFFDSSGNHFIHKGWGYETCPACNYVGNHHVFIEDFFEGDTEFNFKLNVIVYSSSSYPCK